MTEPSISIVLPTRNRAASLARAVGSVVRQTVADWELLVVDDASEDGTAQRVAAWAADDRRIIGIRSARRLGGAGARNAGLERARGRWVALLDDDAEWVPWKLERQRDLAGGVTDVLVYGPVLAVEEDGATARIGGPVGAVEPRAVLLRGNRIDTSAALVGRDTLVRAGGFDADLPRLQDWDLWLRLAGRVRIRYHDEILARTFRTGDRISTRPGALASAADRLARRHAEDPRLLAALGHMLLEEGDVGPGLALLDRALRRGGAGIGLRLRRILAEVSPAGYRSMARASARLRRAMERSPVEWPAKEAAEGKSA